mgnify:CR=1 FL=1
MRKIFTFILAGVSSISLFAMDAVPGPKVLSGGNVSLPLGQQISETVPRKAIEMPAFAPEPQIQMNSFPAEINKLNKDIEDFVKKMTPEAKSLNSADLSQIYLTYKNAQQVNVLLKEQDKVLTTLNSIDGNMKVLIKQNNMLLKFLMEQAEQTKREKLNNSFIQVQQH